MVGKYDEECVSFRAPSNTTSVMRGNFDVLDDNEFDPRHITVSLVDAHTDKKLWKSTRGLSEEAFEVKTTTGGRHELCVDNTDRDRARSVGFAIRVSPPPRAMDSEEEGPDEERAYDLVDWSDEFLEDWDSLMDHYEYLKEREGQHRDLLENIFERIMRWTLLEALTLVLIACGQVMYIRKFFEKRRYL